MSAGNNEANDIPDISPDTTRLLFFTAGSCLRRFEVQERRVGPGPAGTFISHTRGNATISSATPYVYLFKGQLFQLRSARSLVRG